MVQDPPCPLCSTHGAQLLADRHHSFYHCSCCGLLFRAPEDLPDPDEEKRRYEEHNNDVNDSRYQAFVSPIVEAVTHHRAPGDLGLDYGAGTGPVISKLLTDAGYHIEQYDPFFCNRPEVLTREYDYIVCCEVIEHFFRPYQEFVTLKHLLRPNGTIYCYTNIFDFTVRFDRWNYKNDPTHVSIYQERTFSWIKEALGFSRVETTNRLITFSN
ncbi:MAG: methyltransferase domain-containing protein [Spirochaetota bacterium]